MTTAMEKAQAALGKHHGAAEVIQSGGTMQQVQTQYCTAISVQKPRDKRDVRRRVLEEIEMYPEGLTYSWTVKNKDGSKSQIEGPSIRLAMILAREYGNCVVDPKLVSETNSHWILSGTFVDLETGFTCARLFRQRKKGQARGRYDADRLEDIDFQIAQSKAVRGAVVNSMSSGMIQEAIATAKAALANKLAEGGIVHAVERVQKAFGKYDVTVEQLVERLGKPVDKWTKEDIADLRAIYSALEDGQTSAEQEFSSDPGEPPEREPGEEG